MGSRKNNINPAHQRSLPKDPRGFSMTLKYSPYGPNRPERWKAFLGFFFLYADSWLLESVQMFYDHSHSQSTENQYVLALAH
jgi:hypothetical protein